VQVLPYTFFVTANDYKPKDAYGMVYILFFLVGLVQVLPYTFFVTANDYWMYKFRNTSLEDADSSQRTVLQTQFSPGLTITLQLSTISFLFVSLFFGHKFSIKLRMFGPLIVVLTSYIIAAIFIHIDTDTCKPHTLFRPFLTILFQGKKDSLQ
jgi:equilibrative nucleoside transporter 1/2/3